MAAPSQQKFWTEQERRLTSRHSFLDANPHHSGPRVGALGKGNETTRNLQASEKNKQPPEAPAPSQTSDSRARQEFVDRGPTSLPQGSWQVMPAATRKLSRTFKPGPDWEMCGVP